MTHKHKSDIKAILPGWLIHCYFSEGLVLRELLASQKVKYTTGYTNTFLGVSGLGTVSGRVDTTI